MVVRGSGGGRQWWWEAVVVGGSGSRVWQVVADQCLKADAASRRHSELYARLNSLRASSCAPFLGVPWAFLLRPARRDSPSWCRQKGGHRGGGEGEDGRGFSGGARSRASSLAIRAVAVLTMAILTMAVPCSRIARDRASSCLACAGHSPRRDAPGVG